MAASGRKMLGDITNRPEALASRGKAPPKDAAAAPAARQQPLQLPAARPLMAEQPDLNQELEDCDKLVTSFRRLSFDPSAAGHAAVSSAPDDEPAPLEAEDSATSTTTADSSRLGSPLAAFAAAKERLARTTRGADTLLDAWRQGGTWLLAPDATTPPAAALSRTDPASGDGTDVACSGLLASLPLGRTAPGQQAPMAGGASAAAATALLLQQRRNLLPQHQRQHVLLLRERLAATMQLCHALHEQNQANLAKVAALVADNQHLNSCLHEARLDKEGLQATIRALTHEAAMLAEQARRVLLPASQPSVPTTASGRPPRPASAPALMAGAAQPEALNLVRDWSQAVPEVGSCGARCASACQPGAAWHPSTLVRSFDCGGGEVVQGGAASAAAYAQEGGAEGAAGDKRRRLAPGMLAHCLRPAIREAVAEAAAMEAASGSCSCRQPSPGRTPKRKLRQLSSSSVAAVSAAAEGPAAPDAAAEATERQQEGGMAPPLAAEYAAESTDFSTFELFERRWHGAAKAPAADRQRTRTRTCRVM